MNYFMIPMDFLKCDFARMQSEWDKKGKIMWEIKGNIGKNMKIKPSAFFPNIIKKGDIIYFYICKLPSNSGYNKSRVLLRGVVKDEPQIMRYSDIYIDKKDNNEPTIGFSIEQLTTLKNEDLKNDNLYSLQELRRLYDFSQPQGKKWLNTVTKNLDKKLIDKLEGSFKSNYNKSDFNNLMQHFNQECFFKGKLGKASSHKTFVRRNGTDYYEEHHFIQRHSLEKNSQLDSIICDPRNLICLCSNCHNKLHYGRIDEVNEMLDILWKDEIINNMLVEKNFTSIIGAESEEESLDWVKEIYT